MKRQKDMQAALVAKRGHLSKHGINTWHHAYGNGPSYYRTLLVYPQLAIESDKLALDAKLAREQLPPSHANLPAPWLVIGFCDDVMIVCVRVQLQLYYSVLRSVAHVDDCHYELFQLEKFSVLELRDICLSLGLESSLGKVVPLRF